MESVRRFRCSTKRPRLDFAQSGSFALRRQAGEQEQTVHEPLRQLIRQDRREMSLAGRGGLVAQPRIYFLKLGIGKKVTTEQERCWLCVTADGAAHVQDDRPRQAEVREQERAAAWADIPFFSVSARIDDLHADIRQGHAAQLRHPGSVHGDRHQGRPRRDDGVSELRAQR